MRHVTMKRVILLPQLLLFALQTGAQSNDVPDLSAYAWGFPVQTQETSSFYAIELPLEVNQSVTDPELRDAGVFNGDGKPVPRLFTPVQEDVEHVERSNPLAMLPLYESGRADEGQIVLQREGDSSEFSFDLGDLLAPAEGERLVAYIVDTRQVEDSVVALDLIWEQVEPGFMGRVTVEGGSDLQTWSATGAAVVADLRESSASIVQRRVRLRRSDYDYLRIRWEGMPEDWRLSQIMGVHVAGVAESVRKFVRLQSSAVDPVDGGRVFDLGGAPLVDRIQVVLPNANTVVSARIYYRSSTNDRWLLAGQGSYHHIVRESGSVMSEPLAISRTRTGQFKVVITQGASDVSLQLEIGWRPDSLLFLAQGQAPFTLVTGNANDTIEQFPQQRIYGDRSLKELAGENGGMQEASLGPRYVLGGPERMIVSRPTDWRTILLWLALLAGVAFVGYMASKTIRDLKSQKS